MAWRQFNPVAFHDCCSLPYQFMRKRGDKPLMRPPPNETTELLKDWSSGYQTALDRLMPLVYEELHQLKLWRNVALKVLSSVGAAEASRRARSSEHLRNS